MSIIDESSHEEAIVIFITKKDLKKSIYIYILKRMIMDADLSVVFQKTIHNYHTIYMVAWWGRYSYFNNEHFKQGMLYL